MIRVSINGSTGVLRRSLEMRLAPIRHGGYGTQTTHSAQLHFERDGFAFRLDPNGTCRSTRGSTSPNATASRRVWKRSTYSTRRYVPVRSRIRHAATSEPFRSDKATSLVRCNWDSNSIFNTNRRKLHRPLRKTPGRALFSFGVECPRTLPCSYRSHRFVSSTELSTYFPKRSGLFRGASINVRRIWRALRATHLRPT